MGAKNASASIDAVTMGHRQKRRASNEATSSRCIINRPANISVPRTASSGETRRDISKVWVSPAVSSSSAGPEGRSAKRLARSAFLFCAASTRISSARSAGVIWTPTGRDRPVSSTATIATCAEVARRWPSCRGFSASTSTPTSNEARPTYSTCARSVTMSPTRTGLRKSRSSMAPKTTGPRARRIAAIVAAVVIQSIIRPPYRVPRTFACPGSTSCTISSCVWWIDGIAMASLPSAPSDRALGSAGDLFHPLDNRLDASVEVGEVKLFIRPVRVVIGQAEAKQHRGNLQQPVELGDGRDTASFPDVHRIGAPDRPGDPCRRLNRRHRRHHEDGVAPGQFPDLHFDSGRGQLLDLLLKRPEHGLRPLVGDQPHANFGNDLGGDHGFRPLPRPSPSNPMRIKGRPGPPALEDAKTLLARCGGAARLAHELLLPERQGVPPGLFLQRPIPD